MYQKKIKRIGVAIIVSFVMLVFASAAIESFVLDANGAIILSSLALWLAFVVLSMFKLKRIEAQERLAIQLSNDAWERLHEKRNERNKYFDAMFLHTKPHGYHRQLHDEQWRIATAFN